MTIKPKLMTMYLSQLTAFHEVDEARVESILARMHAGETELTPILAINDGYQNLVLDGHHRIAAAERFGLFEIPVYYVSSEQAKRMKEYFGGEWSEQLTDYDQFIVIKDKKYSEIRLVD